MGFNFKGQAVQIVEYLTENDRTDQFSSVKNFQSICVEQWWGREMSENKRDK
jgi:hypothetical protein